MLAGRESWWRHCSLVVHTVNLYRYRARTLTKYIHGLMTSYYNLEQWHHHSRSLSRWTKHHFGRQLPASRADRISRTTVMSRKVNYVLFTTVFYNTVLHCTVLFSLSYNVQYCTILYVPLIYKVQHCTVLYVPVHDSSLRKYRCFLVL